MRSTNQESILLDASVDVARVQDPLAGGDASEHLLASGQLVSDDVRHVGIAEGLIAMLHIVLRQESEEPSNKDFRLTT
jgi:hypothetical protein